MGLKPLGPEWWDRMFGITSFDQFQDATDGLLDLGLPHVSWIDTPIQKNAYLNPLSPTGMYLTASLTASGFHEDSPAGPATVVVRSMDPLLTDNALKELEMVQLIIPGAFQVTIQGTTGGRAVDNVIGVSNAGGTALGAATAVRDAWERLGGPIKALHTSYIMSNYHAVDLSSGTGTIADLASTATGQVGTGSIATRAASALVKWNGGSRSRSTRGRLYFGPLTEAAINADGGTITAATVTDLNARFNQFRNDLTAAGYPLVVLSRKLAASFPVTTQAVESLIATQRRRIRS